MKRRSENVEGMKMVHSSAPVVQSLSIESSPEASNEATQVSIAAVSHMKHIFTHGLKKGRKDDHGINHPVIKRRREDPDDSEGGGDTSMELRPFDNRGVLYLQHEHRSQYVWDAPVSSSRVVRTHSGEPAWDILEAIPPHPRVIDILRWGGIYRCIEVGRLVHDRALVTSMIERWRPETHTFHLRTGEATITLQDVVVIYGLHIDGQALYRVEPPQLSYPPGVD
ncbi:uncharacterized protein LOC132601691 [Lycium barbarum]|uniref:uncharacterized protein LOC132601691 n=1 Tax=Lycium barbarum TaxID=112863 RepID=UPI00293E46FF|nr:uncharacterized protein LOC132601691 [Lycium barbarum]